MSLSWVAASSVTCRDWRWGGSMARSFMVLFLLLVSGVQTAVHLDLGGRPAPALIRHKRIVVDVALALPHRGFRSRPAGFHRTSPIDAVLAICAGARAYGAGNTRSCTTVTLNG